MTIEASREAFEKWAKENGYSIYWHEDGEREKSGKYPCTATQIAWSAWQAHAASQEDVLQDDYNMYRQKGGAPVALIEKQQDEITRLTAANGVLTRGIERIISDEGKHLRNTAMLTSMPPQSSAARDIAIELKAVLEVSLKVGG